jgi:hypothetical protein
LLLPQCPNLYFAPFVSFLQCIGDLTSNVRICEEAQKHQAPSWWK